MIKRLIQNNSLLRSACIRIRNKIKCSGNICTLENIGCSGNRICIRGGDNSLSVSAESLLRDGNVQIEGTANKILVLAESALYGDGGNTVYILGDGNEIVVGKGVSLRSVSFFIRGSGNRIVIEDNCSAISAQFHVEQNNNVILIGAGTTIHGRGVQAVHMAADEGSRIVVGEDCMFAHSTQIRSTDSHSIVDMKGNRLNPAKDIRIGKHCWIGMQCILLKGTEIPDQLRGSGRRGLQQGVYGVPYGSGGKSRPGRKTGNRLGQKICLVQWDSEVLSWCEKLCRSLRFTEKYAFSYIYI